MLLAATGMAHAKELLRARLVPDLVRGRFGVPIQADVTLEWSGARLLEGRLECIIKQHDTPIVCYRTAEMALGGGPQEFRLCLPPTPPSASVTDLTLQLSFITDTGVLELDAVQWSGSDPLGRPLIVCFCAAPAGYTPVTSSVIRDLSLTQFQPSDPDVIGRTARTSIHRLPTEELPSDALHLCAYHLVVLASGSLEALRERQFTALTRWVKAGGSVCIFINREPGARLQRFVQQVAGERSVDAMLNKHGEGIPGPQAEHIDPILIHSGLGRTAIVPHVDGTEAGTDNRPWRRVAAFLWKARAAQLPAMVQDGVWRGDLHSPLDQSVREKMAGRTATASVPVQCIPLQTAGNLVQQLLPGTVTIMPFRVIILILILFVLVIGPGDYLLLGWLNKRKFTWLFFPAVSILFTLFTVALSRHYMGSTDSRNALDIVDLGDDGHVVRATRLDVVFSATEQEVAEDIDHAILAPLRHSELLGGPYATRYGATNAQQSHAIRYTGRFPGRYRVEQTVQQWSPILLRRSAIGPSEPKLKLPWSAVDPRWLSEPDARQRIVKALLGASKPRDCCILLYHGEETQELYGRLRDTVSVPGPHRADSAALQQFLRELCARPLVGFFSLVSQVSPTGAGNFEDLAVLDATDPAEWLLVVLLRDAGSYTMYRQRLCGKSI